MLSTDKERRRLRTIALVARKGGSGKSTLATALAVQHERAGVPWWSTWTRKGARPPGAPCAKLTARWWSRFKRDGCNTYSMPRATAARLFERSGAALWDLVTALGAAWCNARGRAGSCRPVTD